MSFSKIVTHLLFIGLVSVNFSCAKLASPPAANNPPPNIRSLFSKAPGENIVYPTLDISGPKPREKWIQAYQRAVKAGLIPAIPKSKIVDYLPVYPTSYRGQICNPGLNRCNITGNVVTAPPGMAGISFDDGPQPPSLELLDYLKANSQKATHFLIGSRILSNLAVFRALDTAGEHLAVHTFSHPMMSSMDDLAVLGELGWTMQLIYDYSQKQVIARYWRPPYGDLDQRVDAIAKHVFGLETILWRDDPRDWCLADSVPTGSACGVGNGPQSINDLQTSLNSYVHSPKSHGLLILEHEQSKRAVSGFKFLFPLIKKLNWIPKTIPDVLNKPWYQ